MVIGARYPAQHPPNDSDYCGVNKKDRKLERRRSVISVQCYGRNVPGGECDAGVNQHVGFTDASTPQRSPKASSEKSFLSDYRNQGGRERQDHKIQKCFLPVRFREIDRAGKRRRNGNQPNHHHWIEQRENESAGLPHLNPISERDNPSTYQNRSINGSSAMALKGESPMASIVVVPAIAIMTPTIGKAGDEDAT